MEELTRCQRKGASAAEIAKAEKSVASHSAELARLNREGLALFEEGQAGKKGRPERPENRRSGAGRFEGLGPGQMGTVLVGPGSGTAWALL